MQAHWTVEVKLILYTNYTRSEYNTPNTTKLNGIIASSIAMQQQFLQPIIL